MHHMGQFGVQPLPQCAPFSPEARRGRLGKGKFFRIQGRGVPFSVPNQDALFGMVGQSANMAHDKSPMLGIFCRRPHPDNMNHLAHGAKVGQKTESGDKRLLDDHASCDDLALGLDLDQVHPGRELGLYRDARTVLG